MSISVKTAENGNSQKRKKNFAVFHRGISLMYESTHF